MVVLDCPLPGCGFQTPDHDVIGAAAILNLHSHTHIMNPVPQAAPRPSAPKLIRPKIQDNSTCEDWNAFIRRWDTFRIGSGITDQAASTQLLECTTEKLGNVVLRAHPDFTTRTLQDALTTLKSIAVIPVAVGVLRSELAAMRQDPDETFRTFAAKVQGKAETCEFTTAYRTNCANCESEVVGDVYYTDEVIRDVLLNGISDMDIRREALSTEGIQTKPITDIIGFVETRETARNANPLASVSALSEYRKSTRDPNPRRQQRNTPPAPSTFDQSLIANCPGCGNSFHLYTKKARGWNRRPFSKCESCWRKSNSSKQNNPSANTISIVSDDSLGQISALEVPTPTIMRSKTPAMQPDRQLFSKSSWRRVKASAHPKVTLKVAMESRPSKSIDVSAVADTGAQSDLWSLSDFLRAGFKLSDLSPVSMSLNAANKSPIRIDGAFTASFAGRSFDGRNVTCQSTVYVSKDVSELYLSYDTMVNLGIVNRGFPQVGMYSANPSIDPVVPSPDTDVTSICGVTKTDGSICQCPKRTEVPKRPTSLPFPCVPENNDKMRDWLLDQYGSSSFNTCPHQPLPSMDGPPVEIHLQDNAVPVARHKAIPVPVHWQEQVHKDLLRDEALGVIERVPIGEPVDWCHRMVVTRKPDGTPRRTVDLSPLNKWCKRETHNSEAPFHIARRVPRNTWKTVTDAWNGYHSVPLRESDRHLTTFVTPSGRFRYKRAPQGFLSSGDGYNRRFESILADFQHKERIVDDTLFYDTSLEEHWWRSIDFLTTVGRSGIVLNPQKFQFAGRAVDFAGFRISDERIEPLPKFYNAIENFPTPTSTTDIRSWFGLINQVGNYAQLREHVEPFRPFLSPKHPFKWTPELDRAFTASKKAIVEAIRSGVEIFDLHLPTCLRTDWSKHGVGYFLQQKHCDCTDVNPICCQDGWRITLAGSRFLKPTEEHYAPIEGEALAITWGLEQTKYFTLGCDQLTVATDHKPLIKIYGDRTLDEIHNTRLFRLKERSLPWYFGVIHVPGKTNLAPDATSRHPSPSDEEELPDHMLPEFMVAAAIRNNAEKVTSITWERLSSETQNDQNLALVYQAVLAGFPDNYRDHPATSSYWQYRDSLHITDGVIIYNDRVVVPQSLRPAVLDALHAAHQGVSTMGLRARSIVFWPGMTYDIEHRRQACQECIRNAPSQPSLPTSPASPPTTPFEQSYADFFDCVGQHYLVVGDRLSGWSDVFQAPKGSPQAGSEGLITCLRNYFARFGVPEEMSSDGGPEFTSGSTQDFLERWGVRHRLSSAYNPQSNGRAEVAVKSAKRLLRSNTGPSGTLDTDRFLRAMMQLRNTPDPDCQLSPAEIVFGRPIRDAFAFINRLEKFSNEHVRPIWREAWQQKEEALRHRFHHAAEERNHHSRMLRDLRLGDRCYIQNQTGNNPKRWDRSGTIKELHGHDSYTVKVDGTGRLTRRNRRYLRRFEPASVDITNRDAFVGPPLPPLPKKDSQTAKTRRPDDPDPQRRTVQQFRPPQQQSTPLPSSPIVLPLAPRPISPLPPVSVPATQPGTPKDALPSSMGTPQKSSEEPSSTPPRPRRVSKAPRRYVPETGQWA
ncbi:uncharacterized protein [Clytia hemisphaerica]|uniref:uncharacterized protein n=1 Tax=Clytia hemisphaerica TaxID=252671 RepID=UPI0034D4D689